MCNFIKCNSEDKYFPVSDEDINRIEKKFSAVFPAVLREFYLKHNGKNIYMTYIAVDDTDYNSEDSFISVDDVLPLLSSDPYYNVEAIKEEESEEGYIPDSFIPFAVTQGGDNFYWNSDDRKVYVYFDDGTNENGKFSGYLVCSSVEEMFRRMNEAHEKTGGIL